MGFEQLLSVLNPVLKRKLLHLASCMGLVFLIAVSNSTATESREGNNRLGGVIFEDNEFYANNLTGIRVKGDIPVTVKRCRIYSNGRAGIAVGRDAQILITECDIFENGRAGINIDEALSTNIEKSTIHENLMAGIRIWRSGEKKSENTVGVIVSGSKIYMNAQAGIRSMPQKESKVDLVVIENEIYRNARAGLRVENNSRLTAKGNHIYDNVAVGIISHESSIPPQLDIYQNIVSFNGGPGIHIIHGFTADVGIRNNWIFNNLRSGIVCGLWSDPTEEQLNVEIINNTIVSNGSSDQGAGIRNDSHGKAIIVNNIVAYNYVSGIRTRRCEEDLHNLLFSNGDVANCCEDPYSAPYWVERIQIAGCPERGKGDLITNPRFSDPDNYDFSLKDDSPAIDAGLAEDVFNDLFFPPSKGSERNDIGATGGPYAAKES
jgi:hypothetical protein